MNGQINYIMIEILIELRIKYIYFIIMNKTPNLN